MYGFVVVGSQRTRGESVARQERPVDPTAGPLQSLAYDLRKLRVENGSPTYRALARKTGYSASTLSEAASGNRKPTLDVLLAFVGALGGDQKEWRERWAVLDDTVQSTPPTSELPEADAANDDSAPNHSAPNQNTPDQNTPNVNTPDGPADNSKRPSRRLVLSAALVLIVIAAAGAIWLNWPNGSPPRLAATSSGCPATGKSATFSARTYGNGTTIRQGPARADRPLTTVPAGCTIGLVGYCLGEAIIDSTAYTPDVRWFMVAGGGVIASATVHGNPPAGMGLSRCAGDRPAPTAITLGIAADGQDADQITLTATGRNVDVVGYAAYYPDSAGATPTWHQIELTGPGNGNFGVTWNAKAGHPVLAAAACLGGEGPTGVVDLRAYPAGGASPLNKDQQTAAGQIACLYPVAK
jgi:transcriptional regulator with XRE-family HTH domain